MAATASYPLKQLAELLGAELRGDPETIISGLATLQTAKPGQVAFLANPVYAKYLTDTQASAVIVHARQANDCPVSALVMDNPYLGYAKLSHLFDTAPKRSPGIDPTATVANCAQVASSAFVGPNAVISAHAVIGENVVIEAGVYVGDHAVVGDDSRIMANAVIYHEVMIGQRCVVHGGAVIGSDGFGFAPTGKGWSKIAQIGSVVLGNDIEIGANTTIDRGALDNTTIADGVIVDNLVQIAHNVQIGENTAIAGCSAIAGSTRIGKNCVIGGGCGISGHLEITDGVHLTGTTMVTSHIREPGLYSSGTSFGTNADWRKAVVRFWQLNDLAKRLKGLENNVRTYLSGNDR
ncbi:MAG: UDP-3-O-(3-hydroxymyristoyl)glucosamine N-acyltransferase [Hahellaceae bacterium]|nr:UDP-3-O-(3-hydroxymyristoyl)glucosamine N-acyltransferase [Hahellaceae bacterium]